MDWEQTLPPDCEGIPQLSHSSQDTHLSEPVGSWKLIYTGTDSPQISQNNGSLSNPG